jgi:hypothetical protein
MLGDVFVSGQYDSIRLITGGLALDHFGIVFPVTMVTGCKTLVCLTAAASGSGAFVVGHTIFFTLWDDERIARNPLGFFELWAHEMEHIAQFEDWGDAFWPIWVGHGAWLLFEHCVLSPGCDINDINDIWHKQWLERSAEEHTYP